MSALAIDKAIDKEKQMSLTVHGVKLSPFVRKVLVFLEEKGIPYQQEDLVPIPKSPELLEKNPLGKVPILEHDGTNIPDSSVICAYLSRLHQEPSLYPEDPKLFARALFLEEYADTRAVEVVGGLTFERYIKPNFFQEEGDEERATQLEEEELPKLLDFVESQLDHGAETLLGEFSIADVAFGAQLAAFTLLGISIDSGRWPRTASYYDAIMARPSFSSVMAASLPQAVAS